MTTQSEKVALPIQRLAPLRIQLSAFAACGGAGSAGYVGTAQRLGQAEGTDLLQRVDVRKPGFLLLLGGQRFDRAGEQSVVHTHEGGKGGVSAGEFGVAETGEQVGVALAVDRGHDVQFGKLGNHVGREGAGVPPVVGVRLHLSRQPGPDLVKAVALLVAEQVLECVEVAVRVGEVIDVDSCHGMSFADPV